MFRCDACGRVTVPGEPMNRVVAETRPRIYKGPDGEEVGRGSEIVSEHCLCGRCAKPVGVVRDK